MKTIILKITKCLAVIALISACAQPVPIKRHPEYTGVDPAIQPYVNEYFRIAGESGIYFLGYVTMGFKNIAGGSVIGVCNYGASFREIDIDYEWWNEASDLGHRALIFHEMTHCYCGRPHDYGKDKNYPNSLEERVEEAREWVKHGGPRPGYMEDGCPSSLMHPIILNDRCMKNHYNEYVKEMFDRCDPY